MADDDAIADLAELRREVEELLGVRDQLGDVSATVAMVREQLERLASDAAAVRPRVVWWPTFGQEETAGAWAALTEWIDDVLPQRYPEAARVLYPCWDRHPKVVDAEPPGGRGILVETSCTGGSAPSRDLLSCPRVCPDGRYVAYAGFTVAEKTSMRSVAATRGPRYIRTIIIV